jgi:hypothetical protein
MKLRLLPILLAITALAAPKAFCADATKPLKVLLITGGCCHDYTKQKDILKAGIEKRANIEVVSFTRQIRDKSSLCGIRKPHLGAGLRCGHSR